MSEITDSVERLRKVINGMDFVPLMKQDILIVCDAAAAGDKAGYDRGVRDSAAKYIQNKDECSVKIFDAILSLLVLTPPVPVCCEHVRWSNGGWWLVSQVSDHSWPWSAEECPVCGEVVKQSKGS